MPMADPDEGDDGAGAATDVGTGVGTGAGTDDGTGAGAADVAGADDAASGGGAPLRVVAIGASAGGLEPLERLFASLPADTGCAFVVVQHLSPNFRSMMDELLARHTGMRIRRLRNGMTLERDCIHLNTPRSVATLRGSRVELQGIARQTMANRPIDALFHSLAEEHGEHALAIVLSGTGSDGRRGCEHIAERGGTVLAQSPPDARFDSMPRAVVDAGLADATAPADRLGEQVMRWVGGRTPHDVDAGVEESDDPYRKILGVLRTRYGTDFMNYKSGTVLRRMRRRADMRGVPDLERYARLLRRDADELDELYGDLLIEVTSFFRDADAFERVAETAMPELVAMLAEGKTPRIWVPGCASGEEPYSLAILFAEAASEAGVPFEVKIIATDIHGRSLERAALGRYPTSSVQHLEDDRVDRHFERFGDEVRIRDSLRRQVMFSTHDVVRDAPFTRIDLLSCRNLLIYLNRETQRHVIARFHHALSDDGQLFLGPSENVAGMERGFDTLDRKWCLYRKRPGSGPMDAPAPSAVGPTTVPNGTPGTSRPSPFSRDGTARGDDRSVDRRKAYQLALERVVAEHAPPGFLLSESGDVVHIFGDAGDLLPMSRGPFSSRVTELVLPELRAALFAALQIARGPGFDGFARRVPVPVDGRLVTHEIALERIDVGGDAPAFLLLTITAQDGGARELASGRTGGDRAARTTEERAEERANERANERQDDRADAAVLLQRVRDLEHDLTASEDSLQRTIEELEATNEELQSTNEELTASNEELQSTNEELHSVNEELYTVSAEHQHRIEELSELTGDIERLLSSSEIGTVFLDEDLRLRRCNDRAEMLFGLGPRDVGREIRRAATGPSAEVLALLDRAIGTREPLERDLELGGRRHLLRLVPYLDDGGELGGVLMTSVDITELTEARSELRRIDREYRTIVEDTSSFIVRWRAGDGGIVYCNDVYADFFDATPDALVDRSIETLIPEPEREGFFAEIETITPGESRFLAVVREEEDGGATYTVGFTRAIADETGRTVEYQSTGQDLSDEYAYRRALERLVETTKDAALDHGERLHRILTLGLGYLGLSSAFVSRIDDPDYHVVAVAGAAAERCSPGDVLPLGETVCANLPDGGGVLAIDHLAGSRFADHPCRGATGIESFIGANVVIAEGEYGSIAFSSPEPRHAPFTIAEESFVILVASWIGYMIDSRSQLERVGRSNDYHQSLYLGVPVALCLTDERGLITEVSDEWLDHLGREREASLGTPFVDILRASDRASAETAIRAGFAEDLSLCVIGEDGRASEHEMSCRTRTIGTLADRRLIVLTDVSDRRRAMDEIESRNRDLALANENLNQFAFVASHDLQEPLRKIQQFSGFLVEDDRDALSEDGRYHLKVIVEAAERMSTLIRDLLQYSRASRNRLDREDVALDAVLAQVRDDLELPLAESGTTLGIGPLPNVSGDPTLLLQLFTNLIGNAVKYRDPARALRVDVRHERRDGDSVIVVEDNGIGFDPLYARKVFEPFARLHANKDYQGSGIGLAICATVCHKHGWRIEADGRPDEGATFSIALERRDDPSPTSSSPDDA